MNNLEKQQIIQALDSIEQETNLDAVQEQIQYLKKDIESC